MNKTLLAVAFVATLAIGFGLGVLGSHQQTLGATTYDPQHFGGSVYQGMADTLMISAGKIVGPITQTLNSVVNVLANIATNVLIQGASGFSQTISTSTAMTSAQFCATTNQRFVGTSALATSTLPSATSSYATCGSSGGFGAWNGNLITNDSTNTVVVVAGFGTTFKCETIGVGTTTITGGCTGTQISIPASTTVQATGYWDGSSSSLKIMFGNMFY